MRRCVQSLIRQQFTNPPSHQFTKPPSHQFANWFCAAALAAGVAVGRAQGPLPPVDGATLFRDHCATCHDGGDPRAPGRDALRARAPQAIVDALSSGSMRYQGMALSGAERRAIAEYLTSRSIRVPIAGDAAGRCTPRAARFGDPARLPAWTAWSPSIENTHFQPAAPADLAAEQIPRLSLKWAFGFPDASSSWAQPTIAGGRLFIGSQNGTVYSLDAATGCIAWTFAARAGVRASVVIDVQRSMDSRSRRAIDPRPPRATAFVADQAGNVYALDAASGSLRWTRKVDDHPLVRLTGSPVVHGGRLYVPTSSYEEGGRPPGYACCTFRGSVVALDAQTGDVVWKSFTIRDEPTLIRAYADGTESRGPAGAAVWSAPTVDARRGALYVATGNTYSGAPQKTADAILALDLKSGAIRWVRQMNPGERDVFGCAPGDVNCGEKAGPDFDFGASPALVKGPNGRDLLVVGQKSGVVYALDPDRKGEIIWRYRAGGGSGLGGVQWGIATDGVRVYAPLAEIYAEEPGGLHAIDLATGTRAWYAAPPPPACGKPSRACSGALFSAVTAIPGALFSPSNDGAVRAHSTKDGSVVWTFDTNREFATRNGVKARGGSMNGPAPVVAGGMLYVSSGYGTFGLRPGNVLLAFAPSK